MSTSKKLLTGSALRMITLLCGILISFFMMPFVIHSIGDKWYGLWVVAGSVLSFYGMLDLGLSSATQRYISFYLEKKDIESLRSVFNSSLLVFSLIGLAALLLTVLLVALAPFYFESSEELSTFRIVLFLMGATLSLSFPFYALNGILTANYRYDISCYIQLFKLFLRTSLIVYFLTNGYSIISMAVITITVDLIGHLILLIISKKLANWIKLSFIYVNYTRIKSLFSYGIYSFLVFIADKLRFGIDSLVISVFLSLELVTVYTIASQLSSYFMQALGAIIGVLLPYFTRTISAGNSKALKSDYLFIIKFSTAISVCGGAIIMICGPEFVSLWMGEAYSESHIPLTILACSMMIAGMQSPSIQIFYAMAKHNVFAYISLAEGVANIIISILLIGEYGIIGVALGTAIPMVISKLIFIPYFISKLLELNIYHYLFNLSKDLILSATLIYILYLSINQIELPSSYLSVLIKSIIIGIVTLVSFYLLSFKTKDRQKIRSYLSKRASKI